MVLSRKGTCLNLDPDICLLSRKRLRDLTGEDNLSAFVNALLEDFALEESDQASPTAIQQEVRKITTKLRSDRLAQRKLLHDLESRKIEQQQITIVRQQAIEKAVVSEIRRQRFKSEYIYDEPHFTWQRKRDELTNGVSHACQIDLQWRDIEVLVIRFVGLPKDPDNSYYTGNLVQEAVTIARQDEDDNP